MNTKFIIAIGAAAAAAAYFLKAKKQAIENLKVSFLDIYTDPANTNWFDKIAFVIKLKLINTENVAIRVKSIDLNFYVNNKKVADINTNNPIVVNANDDTVVRLNTSIKSVNIIILITELIANKEELKFGIKGIISTDLGDVNINFSKDANI